MSSTRRLRSGDGLTVTETIDLTSLTAEEWRALSPGVGGVAWKIREIERFWRHHAPRPESRPRRYTLRWFARAILPHCQTILSLDEARPEILEPYLDAALRVGTLHEQAFWRLGLGDQARLGIKIRTKNREAARRSRPRELQERARARNKQIADEARRLRRQHPHSRLYSTRWLAQQIKHRQSCSLSTIRRALVRAGIA
jgi:hypothetical protein